MFKTSELGQEMCKLVAAIIALPFVKMADSDLWRFFSDVVMGKDPYINVLSCIHRLLSLGSQVCYGSRTFSEIAFGSNQLAVSQLVKGVDELTALKSQISEVPSLHSITSTAYLAKSRFYIELGNEQMGKTCGTPLYSTVSSLTQRVKTLSQEIAARTYGDVREAPIGFLIYGDPGVGKSTIQNVIHNCVCNFYGVSSEYTRFCRWPYNPDEQFDSGYNSSIVTVDVREAGSNSRAVSTSLGEPALNKILMWMDNGPVVTTQPDLSSKGNVYFGAKCIMIDTNNPSLNADVVKSNPTAFWRRFIHIQVQAKPEYRFENSTALDPSKIKGHDTLDVYNINMYRRRPAKEQPNLKSYQAPIASGITSHKEFCTQLRLLLSEHDYLQKSLVQTLKKGIPMYCEPSNSVLRADFKGMCATVESVAVELGKKPDRMQLLLEHLGSLEEGCQEMFISGTLLEPELNYLVERIKFIQRMYSITQGRLKNSSNVEREIIREVSLDESLDNLIWYVRPTSQPSWNSSWWSNLNDYLWRAKFYAQNWCRPRECYYFFARRRFSEFTEAHWSKLVSGVVGMTLLFGLAVTGLSTILSLRSSQTQGAEFSVEEAQPSVLPKKVRPTKLDVEQFNQRVVRIQKEPPQICYNKPEEIQAYLRTNVRKIRRLAEGYQQQMWMLLIDQSLGVFNYHLLNDPSVPDGHYHNEGKFEFLVDCNGKDHSTFFVPAFFFVVRELDMVFVDTSGLFPGHDISNLFIPTAGYLQIGATCHSVDGETPFQGVVPISFADSPYVKTMPCLLAAPNTKAVPGLCGNAILITMGKATYILGLHMGVLKQQGVTTHIFSTLLTQEIVQKAKGVLKTMITQYNCDFPLTPDVELQDLTTNTVPFWEDYNGRPFAGHIFGEVATTYGFSNKKSSLQKSLLADYAEEISGVSAHDELGAPVFGKPQMGGGFVNGEYKSPVTLFYGKTAVTRQSLHKFTMVMTVMDFLRKVKQALPDEKFDYTPISPLQAVKGCEFSSGVSMRPMNLSTSAGYASGKKSKYVERDPETQKVLSISEDTLELIAQCEQRYRSKKMVHPIVACQLKDEALKYQKVLDRNTRVFCMSPFYFVVLSRMYLGHFYSMLVHYSLAFDAAIGWNLASADVNHLVDRINKFPNTFDIDFSGFDTSLCPDIRTMAFMFVERLLEEGENADLEIIRGILTDGMYPTLFLQGLIYAAPGVTPSGKYATAEDNSILHALIMRYIFYHMQLAKGDDAVRFDDHVCHTVYGDDGILSVSDEVVPWFNQITIIEFGKQMGLSMTPGNKTDELHATTAFKDLTFCKRSFVYRDDIQSWVAPLSLKSCLKTFSFYMPSKFETPAEQHIQAAMSWNMEFCFHLSEEEHWDKRKQLIQICHDIFLVPKHTLSKRLKTWREIMISCRYLSQEDLPNPFVEILRIEEEQDSGLTLLDAPSAEAILHSNIQMLHSVGNDADIQCCRGGCISSLNACSTSADSNFVQHVTLELLERMTVTRLALYLPIIMERIALLQTDVMRYASSDAQTRLNRYVVLRDVASMSLSVIRQSERELYDQTGIVQSEIQKTQGSGEMTHDETSSVVQENVEDFVAATPREDGGRPIELDNTMADVMLIQRYLARPVTIVDTTINVGPANHQEWKWPVWNYWLSKGSIQAKIANYAYFRGSLRLRITIAATPFHYGALLFSYQPFQNINNLFSNGVVHAGPYQPQNLNLKYYNVRNSYLSQARIKAIVDIRQNEPVELELPFLCPRNALHLYSTTDASSTAPSSDFAAMGNLMLTFLTPEIGTATASTASPISLNILAFCPDAELSIPTASQWTIQTQSLKVTHKKGHHKGSTRNDEHGEAPISSLASTVGDVASRLKDVPVIGSFASTVETGAGLVRDVAKFFGWSKPAVLSDPMYVKNMPFNGTALAIGGEMVEKLTFDPKAGLSIHNDFAQTDQDEMSFEYLVGQEFFFGTAHWQQSDTALSTYLWWNFITPTCVPTLTQGDEWATPSTVPYAFVQPTPMAMIAKNFSMWRGTFVMRVQVICSQFHRGRFIIGFEPNIVQLNTISGVNSTINEQHMIIVDIQDTREVEFVVVWASPEPMCAVSTAGVFPNAPLPFSTSAPTTAYEAPLIGCSQTYGGSDITPTVANWVTANVAGPPPAPSKVGFLDSTCSPGYVFIQPLNDLVYPDTSSSGVYLNIYHRWKDVSFAGPVPESPISRQFTEAGVASAIIMTETQSVLVKTADYDPLPDVAGEAVASFRYMLKRQNNCLSVSLPEATTTYTGTYGVGFQAGMFPFIPDYVMIGAQGDVSPDYNELFFAQVVTGYATLRGGYRHRTYLGLDPVTAIGAAPSAFQIARRLYSSQTQNTIATTLPFTLDASPQILATTGDNVIPVGVEGAALTYAVNNNGMQVEVPYNYPRNFLTPLSYTLGPTQGALWPSYGLCWESAVWIGPSQNANVGAQSFMDMWITSSFAEDTQVSWFNGFTPFTNTGFS
jgi:hypothetical protein